MDPAHHIRISAAKVPFPRFPVHKSLVTLSSHSQGYLDPFRELPNLSVITNAQATRVLFKSNTGSRARIVEGVEFIQDGEKKIANALKEVIVSGG